MLRYILFRPLLFRPLLFLPLLYLPLVCAAQSLDKPSLDIAELKNYKAMRSSSNNLDPNSNDDSKRPVPGETVVLADLTGPGVITHMWITVAAREYGWPRLLRLRVYYDGSSTASVDAPLGDFFAVGHGMERPVNSLMVQDSSDGRSRNCYWPMPFRHSAKVTITNEGRQRVANLYYHVDWRKVPSLPSDIGYFHAWYHQETPVERGKHYEFLSIKGRGHYVGTVLSVIQTESGWFGEGDERLYVDGETKPSMEGTGTEDYFNNAWALRITEGPYTGASVAEDGTRTGARISAYRWHIPDPIPFNTSIRFEIEAAGWTYDADGNVASAFAPRADLFSSVAFWYQTGIAAGLREPPYGAARLPHGNARQIEPEVAIAEVQTENGTAGVMKDAFWSRDLLTLTATGAGAKLTFPFDVPEAGRYELLAQIAHAPDYGRYVAQLDGKSLEPDTLEHEPGANMDASNEMNLWSTELYVAEDHLLGWRNLSQGRHWLTFVCTGKDARSSGYGLGVDTLILSRLDSGRKLENAKAAALRHSSPMATVLASLTDPEAEVREAAAWNLTQRGVGAAPAVPALTRALADPSPVVRDLAALSLRNAGGAALPALDPLIAGLHDPDENVRMIAAEAIARFGKKAMPALPALIAAAQVDGQNVHVLRELASAMGAIGPEASNALPVLHQLQKIPRVRWSAEAAIRDIGTH
jgi:Protein of unknown function (DUF2961)/HEAT repeats